VASMLIAGRMALARRRSIRIWVWTTAVIGPIGPLALYLLGDRSEGPAHA
jgi:hypothetical protein